jgi:hypothetical protein
MHVVTSNLSNFFYPDSLYYTDELSFNFLELKDLLSFSYSSNFSQIVLAKVGTKDLTMTGVVPPAEQDVLVYLQLLLLDL